MSLGTTPELRRRLAVSLLSPRPRCRLIHEFGPHRKFRFQHRVANRVARGAHSRAHRRTLADSGNLLTRTHGQRRTPPYVLAGSPRCRDRDPGGPLRKIERSRSWTPTVAVLQKESRRFSNYSPFRKPPLLWFRNTWRTATDLSIRRNSSLQVDGQSPRKIPRVLGPTAFADARRVSQMRRAHR